MAASIPETGDAARRGMIAVRNLAAFRQRYTRRMPHTISADLLRTLELDQHARISWHDNGGHPVTNPATGRGLAWIQLDTTEGSQSVVARSVQAFERWRAVPAPLRGQLVRTLADDFRRLQEPLAELLTLEVGKIFAESRGEIQEIVDIADFAVGLSRQLYGLTMPSERPGHALREQWLPLGPIGVITAFNFPAAVWGWNAMLAAVCGNSVIWKPSLLAPLTALACHAIARRRATGAGHPDLFSIVIGTDANVGEPLVRDRRVPLISATGSCRMGRRVGALVAERLGRSLLELGGNNAAIVHDDADLDLALRAVTFAAVGTAGQRCTTTRRLIVQRSVAEELVARLTRTYRALAIGDPTARETRVGPLISAAAVHQFEHAVAAARAQGGTVVYGGTRATLDGDLAGGNFVQPTIIRAPTNQQFPIAQEETFAPILYVFVYDDLEEAIALQNSVAQGLSSALFTESVRHAERFLTPAGTGSDCGIANINAGTSGAEIGGAFGGEKDTGGGRESGSDAWKAYMRRQTCTVNFAGKLELAQGITFG